jgi:hypothetical protein
MMLDDKTDDLEAVYAAVQGFTTALMVKMEANPLEVAAVLASTAMSIYKTALTPDDFNNIVDAIANSKDQVQPFPAPNESKTVH